MVISGKVVDSMNEPLMGVNVFTKSATLPLKGGITDFDGKFNIELDYPLTTPIVFSYLGYANKISIANNLNNATIQLEQSGEQLNEVVLIREKPKAKKQIEKRKYYGYLLLGGAILSLGLLIYVIKKD
jgi:hypothetical protein